ncbi:hypothetical protein J2T60_001897 [Natronospira proteinivora]|uniref:Endonuclease/exonuclease/phosphatase domain-containing protein n=1 Tax=Natronospira proteinivora TaxID=1807133 RepID=A0ABT1GD78_9GAMM|nr:hypothetical protein [Natronospira proteinivora]MCP1727897.1 hypothetical protein [Natronospira proteinivora]
MAESTTVRVLSFSAMSAPSHMLDKGYLSGLPQDVGWQVRIELISAIILAGNYDFVNLQHFGCAEAAALENLARATGLELWPNSAALCANERGDGVPIMYNPEKWHPELDRDPVVNFKTDSTGVSGSGGTLFVHGRFSDASESMHVNVLNFRLRNSNAASARRYRELTGIEMIDYVCDKVEGSEVVIMGGDTNCKPFSDPEWSAVLDLASEKMSTRGIDSSDEWIANNRKGRWLTQHNFFHDGYGRGIGANTRAVLVGRGEINQVCELGFRVGSAFPSYHYPVEFEFMLGDSRRIK